MKGMSEKLNIRFEAPANLDSDASSDSGGENVGDNICEAALGPERIEQDEEVRLHIEGLNGNWTTMIQSNFGVNLANLPKRFLPPGNVRMLHSQFLLQHPDFKVSYNYFWSVFRASWHRQLKFLPPSTHGCCDQCASFKDAFKTCGPGNLQARYDIAREYRLHLTAVARDRDLEDFLQSCQPLSGEASTPFSIHWDPHRKLSKDFFQRYCAKGLYC